MRWLTRIVALLAAIEGGWMLFDGSRALIVGDYVTPRSGPYAGQLGPWTKVVSRVGIDPRSTLMKTIFATYGTVWLVVIACFLVRARWAWSAMLAAAVGSLWFLPVGTACSAVQVVLLFLVKAGGQPP